jgi:hypothetical protein
MELARNPAMLQELMRSQDRAMSNLEVSDSIFVNYHKYVVLGVMTAQCDSVLHFVPE